MEKNNLFKTLVAQQNACIGKPATKNLPDSFHRTKTHLVLRTHKCIERLFES